jgi:DHA1 family multidrug resistance protein-like MFS transporter
MVADLIRDSPFGHTVRLLTRNKVFQYPEERDAEIWKKYVNQEKSGNMAQHGSPEAPEGRNSSDSSSQTQVGDGVNEASGVRVDPEKGKDKHVIDWYGADDAQVSLTPFPTSSRTLLIRA